MTVYSIVGTGYPVGAVAEMTTFDGFALLKESSPTDAFLGQFNAFGAHEFATPSDSRAEHIIEIQATVQSGDDVGIFFNMAATSATTFHGLRIAGGGGWNLGECGSNGAITSSYSTGTLTHTADGTTYNIYRLDASNTGSINLTVNGSAAITEATLTNPITNLRAGMLLGWGGEVKYFQIGAVSAAGRLRPPYVVNKAAIIRGSVH